MKSTAFWRRHWFLFALVLVAIAAFHAPETGLVLRRTGWALPLLTSSSLFLSGIALDSSRLREGVDFRGLAIGLSSTYVIAPALAVALAHLFGPANHGVGSEGYFFFEAMMIVAAQATTIASASALTLVAGGNQALALLITLSSNLSTAFVTPMILRSTVGTIVSFPVARMMREDAIVVLLPVIAGLATHRLFAAKVRRVMPAIVAASQTIILIFVGTGVSSAASRLSERLELVLAFLATAAALHFILVVWNHQAATRLGLSAANRTAVVFCGSQKTLPNGIYLWDTFFSSNPYGALALVCYHVFQLVVDSLLVPWLAPTPGRPAPDEEVVDGA